MSHPFRRYCFSLGERLGKSLNEVLQLSSLELSEWMAYDLTREEKWSENYNKKQELERQKSMSNQERADLLKQLLGGT